MVPRRTAEQELPTARGAWPQQPLCLFRAPIVRHPPIVTHLLIAGTVRPVPILVLAELRGVLELLCGDVHLIFRRRSSAEALEPMRFARSRRWRSARFGSTRAHARNEAMEGLFALASLIVVSVIVIALPTQLWTMLLVGRQRRVLAGAGVAQPLLPCAGVVRPQLPLDAPRRRLGGQTERIPLRSGQAAWGNCLGV
jgi:hypothetical protein